MIILLQRYVFRVVKILTGLINQRIMLIKNDE